MNEAEYIAYFKAIAETLIAIEHSEGVTKRFATIEEFPDAMKTMNTEKQVMIVKNERGGIDGVGQGNLLELHECSVSVLKKCRNGDFAAMHGAYQDTLTSLRKILGKMALDKRNNIPFALSLKLEGVQFEKIGPYSDCLYGYELTFYMNSKSQSLYEYQSGDWNE
jgi:hypothetical protein